MSTTSLVLPGLSNEHAVVVGIALPPKPIPSSPPPHTVLPLPPQEWEDDFVVDDEDEDGLTAEQRARLAMGVSGVGCWGQEAAEVIEPLRLLGGRR
jgi:hypothetical protein